MKSTLIQKTSSYRLPTALAVLACALAGLAQAKEMPLESIQEKAGEIDRLITAKLEKEKIQPTAPVTDDVFVRRIYLDIAGRIPSLKETTDFLADKDTNKRAKLIDALLASDGYVQNFTNYWSDILRVKSKLTQGNSQPAGEAYGIWLRESLKTNKPYDKMVQEMLTASGKTYENGAVGYYIRDYNMPLDNMAMTTQVFLGTSMVCAQCHNHPFDKWTQMDYYQMSAHSNGMVGTNGLSNPLLAEAFYGRPGKGKAKKSKKADPSMDGMMMGDAMGTLTRKDISRAMSEIMRPLRYNTVLDNSGNRGLRLPKDYQYDDAKPGSVVQPVIPASFSNDGKIVEEGVSPIHSYAKWLASKENPRFTLVIANRLWKKAMGMALIEPVDEITDSTVPSNPQLMTFLETTMKDLNYDMKEYLRIIFNSATYQRAAYSKDVELGEVYHFPGPLLRRMSAEQIWDSMVTLYKPAPDAPNLNARIARETVIRQVEWLDRSLNALSAQELAAGAAKVMAVQKQLAADVRKAQEVLAEASKNNDEEAMRAAKRVVSNQRRAIDEAAEDIIYSMGFKKFAELIREGKIEEQVEDAEFAKEIASVLRNKKDDDVAIDDALRIMAKQQRARLTAVQQQRLKKDADLLKANTKQELHALQTWESFRDTYMVRASDLRSPAPNGHFLREFGQSDRELVSNANGDASVGQALMLLNGKTFTQLMNPYTMISRALRRAETAEQTVDTIYLSLFSRKATAEEKELLAPVVEGNGLTGKGDALWAALNTRQFYFIQ
ncbi:DUF1549 domain-containing protein [Prosthecobacter fusiformis]|nr:DUF1549 domain-containing protein [Prosthecobacter fusiformis]